MILYIHLISRQNIHYSCHQRASKETITSSRSDLQFDLSLQWKGLIVYKRSQFLKNWKMYALKNYFFSSRIMFVYFLLVLNLHPSFGCSSSEPAEYRVLRKTDSGNKQLIVAVDESAKLFCRTNVPWKKCIWKPPRNGVRQVMI